MSNSKNAQKLTEKNKLCPQKIAENADTVEKICNASESSYAVTLSKKLSGSSQDSNSFAGQKSFISIHSTDQPCQVAEIQNPVDLEECNVEVLSLNEVFPSTSEESVSNDESPVRRRHRKKNLQKVQPEEATKPAYIPTNSKSSTTPNRINGEMEAQATAHSDFDIPRNTLYVTGSNPGEPKMSYHDTPKKMSKTMKKFLRNVDKHKNEKTSKMNERAISKLTTMRGILKDGRCVPECTGDSSLQDPESFEHADEDLSLSFAMNFGQHNSYTKHNADKNVSFNTQVLIIHFTGDLCVGQSIEALSKEKDQQARNSELRKTFNKYNELWPTHK